LTRILSNITSNQALLRAPRLSPQPPSLPPLSPTSWIYSIIQMSLPKFKASSLRVNKFLSSALRSKHSKDWKAKFSGFKLMQRTQHMMSKSLIVATCLLRRTASLRVSVT